MSKLKESQMAEWLESVEYITQHVDNDDDSVLRARSRAVQRSPEGSIKGLIEGWLACDQAHSRYTGL